MIQQRGNPAPAVGNWYDSKDFYECFKVIDCDTSSRCVEIQYYDGDIEEIDFDTWIAAHPHEISEPEDANAPYELDHEDILTQNNEVASHDEFGDYLKHLHSDDY